VIEKCVVEVAKILSKLSRTSAARILRCGSNLPVADSVSSKTRQNDNFPWDFVGQNSSDG